MKLRKLAILAIALISLVASSCSDVETSTYDEYKANEITAAVEV